MMFEEDEKQFLNKVLQYWLEDVEYDVINGDADKVDFYKGLRLYYVMTGIDWEHTSGPYTHDGVRIENERFGRWW